MSFYKNMGMIMKQDIRSVFPSDFIIKSDRFYRPELDMDVKCILVKEVGGLTFWVQGFYQEYKENKALLEWLDKFTKDHPEANLRMFDDATNLPPV